MNDYFMRLDGIEGECSHESHRGEIVLLSWSWGESNAGSFASGGGSGKVSMQDLHFVMSLSKASPKLMLVCARGLHIPSAVLTGRRAGGAQDVFMKLKFGDVLISSYQTGCGQDQFPTEQVALNFARVEFEYFPQKADGSQAPKVITGWDVLTNTQV